MKKKTLDFKVRNKSAMVNKEILLSSNSSLMVKHG